MRITVRYMRGVEPNMDGAKGAIVSPVISRALVHARGLRKTYGEFIAVDGVDFDVHRGQAFGFLGPNGAGKSSTMRMIQCVSPPSAGSLQVLGMDPAKDGPRIRARLGVVPQEDTLDAELTVRENLLVYARYFGMSWAAARDRAGELLEFVQLGDKVDARVQTLSGGMKRRLTIARSLVNSRTCCCSTSPPPGWTRRPGTWCGTGCSD